MTGHGLLHLIAVSAVWHTVSRFIYREPWAVVACVFFIACVYLVGHRRGARWK